MDISATIPCVGEVFLVGYYRKIDRKRIKEHRKHNDSAKNIPEHRELLQKFPRNFKLLCTTGPRPPDSLSEMLFNFRDALMPFMCQMKNARLQYIRNYNVVFSQNKASFLVEFVRAVVQTSSFQSQDSL